MNSNPRVSQPEEIIFVHVLALGLRHPVMNRDLEKAKSATISLELGIGGAPTDITISSIKRSTEGAKHWPRNAPWHHGYELTCSSDQLGRLSLRRLPLAGEPPSGDSDSLCFERREE